MTKNCAILMCEVHFFGLHPNKNAFFGTCIVTRPKTIQYYTFQIVFFWPSPKIMLNFYTCIVRSPKNMLYYDFWVSYCILPSPPIFRIAPSQDQIPCNNISCKVHYFGLYLIRMPNFFALVISLLFLAFPS